MAVGPSNKEQDFESELLAMGVDHSQKAEATPIASDYGSKDCAFLPDPTAVFRLNDSFEKLKVDFLPIEESMANTAILNNLFACMREGKVRIEFSSVHVFWESQQNSFSWKDLIEKWILLNNSSYTLECFNYLERKNDLHSESILGSEIILGAILQLIQHKNRQLFQFFLDIFARKPTKHNFQSLINKILVELIPEAMSLACELRVSEKDNCRLLAEAIISCVITHPHLYTKLEILKPAVLIRNCFSFLLLTEEARPNLINDFIAMAEKFSNKIGNYDKHHPPQEFINFLPKKAYKQTFISKYTQCRYLVYKCEVIYGLLKFEIPSISVDKLLSLLSYIDSTLEAILNSDLSKITVSEERIPKLLRKYTYAKAFYAQDNTESSELLEKQHLNSCEKLYLETYKKGIFSQQQMLKQNDSGKLIKEPCRVFMGIMDKVLLDSEYSREETQNELLQTITSFLCNSTPMKLAWVVELLNNSIEFFRYRPILGSQICNELAEAILRAQYSTSVVLEHMNKFFQFLMTILIKKPEIGNPQSEKDHALWKNNAIALIDLYMYCLATLSSKRQMIESELTKSHQLAALALLTLKRNISYDIDKTSFAGALIGYLIIASKTIEAAPQNQALVQSMITKIFDGEGAFITITCSSDVNLAAVGASALQDEGCLTDASPPRHHELFNHLSHLTQNI